MAQALSEEEFHRMQAQLLELRTQNYQLSDDLRKNTAELNAIRQKTSTLEKDYVKAQKALSKSKKAQEVDALLSENEMLQGKLHSQEDDFRLQNSTLMQELSKLCSQIEQLEQENAGLKEGRGLQPPPPSPASSPVDGELLRLQAENSALQKKMSALQERYEKDTQTHRGAEPNDLQASETDGQTDSNGVQAHPEAGPEGEESAEGGASDRLEQMETKCAKLEQRVKKLSEVELQLHTEVEEKRLLKEQLQTLESSKQTDMTKLQEELAKLSDKLKKKQESFLRLQGEKEALYNDSRTKIDEIQQRKEEELKSMNIRIQKLQADLMTANQASAELKEQILSREKEHELSLHALRDQIQTVKTQEMNLLRDQNMALNVELQQRQAEQEKLLAHRDDLSSQLQELNRANSRLLEQLGELGQEKDKLQQGLEESRKTADKRKAMLDELAIELAQEKSRHKEELSDARLQHEKEVLGVRARYEKELRGLHEDKNRTEEEIRSQLRDEKARSRELESLQQTVEDLQAQIQSMEGAKGWFERRLKEAEETVERNTLEHTEQLHKLQLEQAAQLQGKMEEIEAVKQQLAEMEKEKDEQSSAIVKLKQEIKDTVDGQRILEKKGSSALKDLKRQLHLERKRADKLQERLQEILTNTKTRTGLEDLVLSEISSPSRTQQTGDSSSVSSYSYREIMKEGASAQSANKSNTGSPQSQRPADLSDDEVGELFQRLAEVQQEKWMLEEKVKHLEVSCSSMADDICKKSAIIETYVMDSRRDVSGAAAVSHGSQAERGSLGSVLRDLVKPGDENLREMNKKLQNMLEEQLTKNMHLQKDLEVLSQEIVRLSKDACTSPGGDPPATG
ncbi:GRIP1-associated protein 1 isoform X2 [Anguilla anguilla]|uniref:GRIP1-associated protein 1 isoform X2 n=1 Tax=Anguilla anguilla TaxID=7936 RepID=UPI0015A951D0|nr:GRIP1-associated protein 1 isoform X2 [Anguilla anguilla]